VNNEKIMETGKRIIVVLGMHRSGTSAITRGLMVAGVSLGDRLLPAVKGNNDKGFWEDIDVNELNIEMLNSLSSDWHHLSQIRDSDVQILADSGFFLRADDLLRKKLSSISVYGIKDPRIAKLLPFWREVFRRGGFDVSYVIAVRNPLSVVKSLKDRDGFLPEKTYFLWLGHVLNSLVGSVGSRRLVVDYDLLMKDAECQLTRMAKELELPLNEAELQVYKNEFLDGGLQHSAFKPGDLGLDNACPSRVREIYEALVDVASDQVQLDDPDFLKKIEHWAQEYGALADVLRFVDRVEAELARTEQYKQELDGQIARLGLVVAERDHAIVGLNQAVAECDGEISRLYQVVVERDHAIAELNQAVAECDGEVTRLNQVVVERDHAIAELNQAVAERDGEIARLNREVVERDTVVLAMRQSNCWKITSPLRLLGGIVRGAQSLIGDGGRRKLLQGLKPLYRKIPARYRGRVLSFFFEHFGALFKGVPSYEFWRGGRNNQLNPVVENTSLIIIDDVIQSAEVTGTIAIHLHMYYSDLAGEFASYLRNMPFNYDLFVSVTDSHGGDYCRAAFSALPLLNKLVIELVPNRGRDMAPMFCTFGQRLKSYDYIAHLHSKKSLYNSGAAEGWRQYLCKSLLGSATEVRRIFSLLQDKQSYGIVYPQNYHMMPHWANTWLANRQLGAMWCSKLGILNVPTGYFDYPVGSMFWARSSALRPLFDANITLNDFPEEAGQKDGTFAHCLERLLVLAGQSQGFSAAIIKDKKYPSWSEWRFDQCLFCSHEYYRERFNDPGVKLIGFDIFDTLLVRPMIDPESVKKIVARRMGQEIACLYLKYRPLAENLAREYAGRDVGMAEIYSQFQILSGVSDELVSQLRFQEEYIERQSVRARSGGVELYQEAIASGKPVVLISDMFLDKSHIAESLRVNGIEGWHSLFVSNEIGDRKDTGKLYDFVFASFEMSPSQFLMVGDNERSDIQIPVDKGAGVIPLLRPVEMARGLSQLRPLVERLEGAGDLDDQISLGLILQKEFSPVFYPGFDPSYPFGTSPFNIGYGILGPVLLAFSQWLIERSDDVGVSRLYFLAREGELIKKVYDMWVGEDMLAPQSDYLVVSRRATTVAALSDFDDVLEIARATYFPNKLSNFLFERFGIYLSVERWEQVASHTGWSRDSTVEISGADIGEIHELLVFLSDEILESAAVERVAMDRYLVQQGLYQDGRQAVVDVGYGGTIQNNLNSLLSQSVHGFYLMTDERSSKVSTRHQVIVDGCYHKDVACLPGAPLMYRYSFELEKMMSSSSSQVVKYILDGDGIRAVHRELSLEEKLSQSCRDNIQAGVIGYVEDALKVRQCMLPDFKPSLSVARDLYDSFIGKMSSRDSGLFNEISLDDYYCGRGVVN